MILTQPTEGQAAFLDISSRVFCDGAENAKPGRVDFVLWPRAGVFARLVRTPLPGCGNPYTNNNFSPAYQGRVTLGLATLLDEWWKYARTCRRS